MSSKVLRLAVACAVSLTMTAAVIPVINNLADNNYGVVRADGTIPTEGEWILTEDSRTSSQTLDLTGNLTIDLRGYLVEFKTINTNGYDLTIKSTSYEGNLYQEGYGSFSVGTLNVSGSSSNFIYEVVDTFAPETPTAVIDTLNVKDGGYACFEGSTFANINNIHIHGAHSRLDNGSATIYMPNQNPVIDIDGNAASYTGTAKIDSPYKISITLKDYATFSPTGSIGSSDIIVYDLSMLNVNTNSGGYLEEGTDVYLHDKSRFVAFGDTAVNADITVCSSDIDPIKGPVAGNLVINQGLTAEVNGTLTGNVTLNNNSKLVISGTVNGNVLQKEDDSTVSLEITPDGVLNNPQSLSFHRTASTFLINGAVNSMDVFKANAATFEGATVNGHLTIMGALNDLKEMTIEDSTIKWLTAELTDLTITGSTVTTETDFVNSNIHSAQSAYKGTKLLIGTDCVVSLSADTVEAEAKLYGQSKSTFRTVTFKNNVDIQGSGTEAEFIICISTEDGAITASKSASLTFTGDEYAMPNMYGRITIDGTPSSSAAANTSVTIGSRNLTVFRGGFDLINGAAAEFNGGIFDDNFINVKSGSKLVVGNVTLRYGLYGEGDGSSNTTEITINHGANIYCPVQINKAKLLVTDGRIESEGNAIILDNAVDVKIYGGSFKSSNAYCIYDGGSTPSEKITVSGGTFDCGVNIDTPILSEGDCEDQNSLVKVLGGHFDAKVSPKFIPVNKLQIIDDNSDYSATPYTIIRFEENLDYEVVAMTPADCCNPGNRLYLKSFYYGDYLPYDLQYSYREATEKDIVIPAEGHDYHDFDDATIDPANATWHYEYTAGTKQHFIDSAYVHLKCSKCGETIKVEDETPLLDPAHEGINTYRFSVVLKNINNPDIEITNVKSIRYAPNVYMQVSAGSTFTVKLAYVFPIDYDSGDTDMLLYYISKFNGQEIDEFEDEITRVFNANIGEETGYIMSVTSPAKDMSNKISFEIESYDEEGAIVSDALSISDYAKMLINDTEGVFPGNNENVRNFCRAMLSYGHAAQDQFGTVQDPEDYADYGVTGTGIDYSGVEVPTEEFDKEGLNEILASVDAPVSYYGMSATLKSNPYFTLVFKVTSGSQSDALTWVKNRINIAYVDKNTGRTPDIKVTKSGETYIKVVTPALKISEIDQLYGIRVLGASNTNRTTFGLDTFVAGVNAMKSSESKTTMLNLCKALINYYNYSQILIKN